MQSVKASQTNLFLNPQRLFLPAVVLIALLGIGLYAYNAFIAFQVKPPPLEGMLISQQTLAAEYGLEVNLVAVTAAGGLVDLRLRIIDGEKAKALLADQANFPTLLVGSGIVLRASQDITSQPINFDNDSHIFVLYPNSQNILKPGDLVTIVFGDLQVEAIQTR